MKRSTTLAAVTAGAVLALAVPVAVAGSAGAESGVRLRLVETNVAFHFSTPRRPTPTARPATRSRSSRTCPRAG